MIYFDSSALIKLIAPDPESRVLSEWVQHNWNHPRVTSAVSKVDVLRSFRDMGPAAEDLASIVVSKIEQLPVRQEILDNASELGFPLGSVEAIHLASASQSREGLHAFVSYDPVMLEAAQKAGLATASPGAE
ncbi:type II toxin-antitoxin system VapC family toxin [Haloactinomyces albus]|uniref:Nucleic acid-binding protein n=1 Tax=Haloactinomyces albus TaxID=1352928 RepID=A0AAE3ZBM8_9ACTN|nr:type II toxin-antitoxin system VapC family toxin [Haloactinomyces albus]MDR7300691.1 putative nucleic acid-binding protein [Haloactinomyces albus]